MSNERPPLESAYRALENIFRFCNFTLNVWSVGRLVRHRLLPTSTLFGCDTNFVQLIILWEFPRFASLRSLPIKMSEIVIIFTITSASRSDVDGTAGSACCHIVNCDSHLRTPHTHSVAKRIDDTNNKNLTNGYDDGLYFMVSTAFRSHEHFRPNKCIRSPARRRTSTPNIV